MATITPRNDGLLAGIAARSDDTLNPDFESLLTGDIPAVFSTEETVLTTQDLAAHTVVGFDGSGKIVPANNTTVPAIGVLAYAIDTTGGDATAHVYRGGVFNPDMLVWDAAYDTDAKKAKAFEGAPSPTAIVIRKIQTLAV